MNMFIINLIENNYLYNKHVYYRLFLCLSLVYLKINN